MKEKIISHHVVSATGEISRGDYILANINITVPICKNAGQQNALLQQVKEWVTSDEFWISAYEQLNNAANECRLNAKTIMFVPGESNN